MTGWAPLLGALGLVAVVFGLVSFVLLLFGAPSDPAWIYGNFAVGVALLGSAVALNLEGLRERLSSGEARRAGKYGTSALASTLLGLVIIGCLGFLATRHSVRWDWTEAELHSLSSQSVKILAGLERSAEVTAFVWPAEEPGVRALLDRYSYVSEGFQVQYVNPTERPDMVASFGIDRETLNRPLIRVALGDPSVDVTEVNEESVTNALVNLTRSGERTIYFLEGHNERPIQGVGADESTSFSRAAEALRNEAYRTEPLLLASKGSVPEDADAVVIAGPTRPMLAVEREALGRYLETGGSLLVLIDPRAKTDLYADLESWGVEVGDDVIVDRQLALFGRATSPFASSYDRSHPITRELRETTLFDMARSVRPRDGAEGDLAEIVLTGENSWAERDLEQFYARGRAELGADDLAGPVSLAVAGKPRLAGDDGAGDGEVEARLVVFGDSDFASNEYIEAYLNRDLFLNTVNWLLGDVEAISIRPRVSRASRFQLSTEQFSTIRVLSLFVLPEAIAALGVLTWWRRRRG